MIETPPDSTIAVIEDEHERFRKAGFERTGDLVVFAGAVHRRRS